MLDQDKVRHGTRVRYINNDGDMTQRGTIVGPVTPPSFDRALCDCGRDRYDQRHESVWVKWDNGTKSMVATCHITERPDLVADNGITL